MVTHACPCGMRKPAICVCEIKGTDQLHVNKHAADQHLRLRYIDSTIPLFLKLILKFKPLAIFFVCTCTCTSGFVPDLVGHREDRFSCEAPHLHV